MRSVQKALVGAGVVLVLAGGARADDVTDQIDEAVKAYGKKDMSTAAAALDAASKLIRQKRADTLAKLLPDALPGWKADDAENTSVGSELMGGGTNVSRKYTKDSNTVDISVTADSPLVAGMGALLGNVMFTGSDNKLVVVDGRKLTYTKSDNSYQGMVGKSLVKVTGNQGTDDETLKTYFKAIKLDDIEKGNF